MIYLIWFLEHMDRFVRMNFVGGGSSLSREELDEVRAEVDAEFEAEERLLKKKGKKQNKVQRSSQSTEDDLGSLFGGGINGKLPRFANRITLKVWPAWNFLTNFSWNCRGFRLIIDVCYMCRLNIREIYNYK